MHRERDRYNRKAPHPLDPRSPPRDYSGSILSGLARMNASASARENTPSVALTERKQLAPAALPPGTRQGTNDWKQTGYRGPCPPIGRHRYFHKLYALDVVLGDRGALAKPALEGLIAGHVLAQAELVGTYQKGGR